MLLLVRRELVHYGPLDSFLLFAYTGHPLFDVRVFHLMLSQAEDEVIRKLFYSPEDVDIHRVLWIELPLL